MQSSSNRQLSSGDTVNSINSEIEAVNALRLKCAKNEKRKVIFRRIMQVIYVPPVILSLVAPILPFLWPYVIFGFVVAFLEIILNKAIFGEPREKYSAHAKGKFYSSILTNIENSLAFDTENKMEETLLVHSNLLGNQFDLTHKNCEVEKHSLLTGYLGGSLFQCSQVIVKKYKFSLGKFAGVMAMELPLGILDAQINGVDPYATDDSPRNRSDQKESILFNGSLFVIDTKGAFEGTTIVRTMDRRMNLLSEYQCEPLGKVQIPLAAQFEIATSSEESARSLLTPETVQALTQLSEICPTGMSLSFIDGIIYFGFDINGDLFRFGLNGPLISEMEVVSIEKLFGLVNEIIAEVRKS